MINRRFMIVPPALPSGGHAEQLEPTSDDFSRLLLETANMRVPLLLLAIAGWEIWQQELHIAQDHTRNALSIIAEEPEKVFDAQDVALSWVDDHVRGQSWDAVERSAELHQFLSNLDRESNYIDSIWLFDAASIARATTRAFPLVMRINVAAGRPRSRNANRWKPRWPESKVAIRTNS